MTMLPLETASSRLFSGVNLCFTVFFAYAMILTSVAFSQPIRTFQNVDVRGAEFIPEQDIKATCGAVPNVPYLDLELQAIEDCLKSTGVFESVALIPEGDTLVIQVEELNTRPGRIEGSIAYASDDGLIAGLFYERYNLFPDTYGLARMEVNEDVRRVLGQLYRVDVFGDSIDLGFKAGWEDTSYDNDSFSHETHQAEVYFAWTPNEALRFEAGLGYRHHRLYDVVPATSALVLKERTSGIDAPYLRLSLQHSSLTAEDTGWSSMGYDVGLDHYFWNLGTSDALSDFRLEARSYIPLSSRTRLVIGLDAGTVSSLGNHPTRVIDRFATGGNGFRGFAPRGIGPRDQGVALGGENYVVSTFELQRNLEDVFEAPLIGGLFWQTGGAWKLDDTLGGSIDDSFHKRSSVGVSVSFKVGATPVSIFAAVPVEKEPGDKEQLFGLNLTTNF